jgi:hypothetical protein
VDPKICPASEARLCVELGQGDGRELFDQLVIRPGVYDSLDLLGPTALLQPEQALLLLIKEIEQLQTFLARSKRRPGSEARLGVELGQGDSRELFDQLVHADLAPLSQLAKTLMLLVGQTDRQGSHSDLLHELFGLQDPQAWELELGALEIPDVLRDQDRSSTGHGQLDEMVVRLVSQIGAPAIVDRRPATDAEIGIEEGVALPGVESASLE